MLLDKLIEGSSETRSWQEINIDLSKYRGQEAVLRPYQRVLIPHHEAGNACWRDLEVR